MAIQKDKNGKPISRDYEDFLSEMLQDPQEAREYLNAALEDEDYRVFLLALRDVAKAYGISRIASETNLNRESLYKTLSESGNPQISSLIGLLRAVGVRLSTEVINEENSVEHHEETMEVAAVAVNSVAERKYTRPKIVETVEFFQPVGNPAPYLDYSGLALSA